MKINLVLGHQLAFPPLLGGGVENLVWGLARSWQEMGHEVVAYSRLVLDLPAQQTDEFGIKHRRVAGWDRHANVWVDHFHAWKYAGRIRSVLEPADITSFHTPFSFRFVGDSSLGVLTHTIHRSPKWIVRLYRKLDRNYGGSDAVIQQAAQIDPSLSNLKRIYNAFPFGENPPSDQAESEKTEFIYFGRFVPDKGIEALLRGFAQIAADFPHIRLATLGPQIDEEGGDSKFYHQMRALVHGWGLDHRICFEAPIYDKTLLHRRLGRGHVICVPTIRGETFSMAILEAMSLAKPILTSDFPPMKEAVDHGETGYIARAGDVSAMAGGLRFFASHPDRIEEMGGLAFRRAKERFSLPTIAAEYLEDFRHLQEKRKLPQ